MWGLLCVAPIYYAVRISDIWSGQSAVELARSLLNDERAQSLEFRLDNEDLLIAKALQRPIFGWGGWGRNFVYDESEHRRVTVVDGMWIIALGSYGCRWSGFDGHGHALAGGAVPQALSRRAVGRPQSCTRRGDCRDR